MFVKQIERITGSRNCITQTVRLDYFEGSKEYVNEISYKKSKCGIKQLLCADSSTRASYFLNEEQENKLNKTEKITSDDFFFIKTDFRFDNIKSFKPLFNENKEEEEVVVFTHEWLLQILHRKNLIKYFVQIAKSYLVKRNINKFCSFYKERNSDYIFEF